MKLIFFHGSPGSPDDFSLVAEELRGHECVRVARSGYPGSNACVDGRDAVLVGYSWGSMDALRTAASGASVRGVFLVAPYLFPSSRVSPVKKALVSLPWLGDRLLSGAGSRAVDEMVESSVKPKPVPSKYRTAAEKLKTPQVLRRAFLEKSEPGLGGDEVLAACVQRGIPVGVVSGRHDPTATIDTQIDPIRKKISLIADETFEDGGHALPWTHPRELSVSIERFLKKIGGAS